MTPAARIAAAIDILDAVQAGAAAEKTLTGWARRNRYAGSGDRAAIRDHVFDVLRNMRSFAWLGGAETGRGLMLGALRHAGLDPADFFTGNTYAPASQSEAELAPRDLADAPAAVQLDIPDWLLPLFQDAHGTNAKPILRALRDRAPVFLRVNPRKTTLEQARADLAGDGIDTALHPLAPGGLHVLTNPRRIQNSAAYKDGHVELQDIASQAIADSLTLADNHRVLDFCAGGGGKSLALAARSNARIFAHDIDPGRMADLPVRAARAGVDIQQLQTAELDGAAPFDHVLCDAPCSGSGAWRRAPEAKWRLTPERLAQLVEIQSEILDRAATLMTPGGSLTYVTCSLLDCENQQQVVGFLTRHPGWSQTDQRQLTPLDGGDGFFAAHLTAA